MINAQRLGSHISTHIKQTFVFFFFSLQTERPMSKFLNVSSLFTLTTTFSCIAIFCGSHIKLFFGYIPHTSSVNVHSYFCFRCKPFFLILNTKSTICKCHVIPFSIDLYFPSQDNKREHPEPQRK